MLKQLFERNGIRHCQRGNVAIETAFAIPMLVGLALGAAEFGRAFSAKSELANVARAGAQAALEFSVEDESLSNTVRSNLILAGLLDDPDGQGFDVHTQPQTSSVVWIGVRPARRQPLQSVQSIAADTEYGLDGDHYSKQAGNRQVTLIQAEHLDAVASMRGTASIDPGTVRRNIVVGGINLLALKDKLALGPGAVDANLVGELVELLVTNYLTGYTGRDNFA